MSLPTYPAPGASSKTDGVSVRLSGGEAVQRKLLDLGPAVKTRVLRVIETLGRELAVEANMAAPVGKDRKRKRGGGLARSFGVYARPQWEKFGLVGVAVRSKAKYHYYQEFGVDRPNAQVLLYRTDAGKKVRRGQGIDARHGRFAIGTNRLNPGVRVRSYRRDIILPATTFFGRIVAARKGQIAADIDEAVTKYLDRMTPSGGP